GPAEPGAVLHAVLDRRGGGRLSPALGDRLHVLLAVAQHAEGAHEFRVLLEVRARLLYRERLRVVDAHPESEDQILPARELAALGARRALIVVEPPVDELLGGGRDDALDPGL